MNQIFPFTQLCTELQLLILSYCHAHSLSQLLKTDTVTRDLAVISINEQVCHHTGIINDHLTPQRFQTVNIPSHAFPSSKTHFSDSDQSHHRAEYIEKKNNLEISIYSPNNISNNINHYKTNYLNSNNSRNSLYQSNTHSNSSVEELPRSDKQLNLSELNDKLIKIQPFKQIDNFETSYLLNTNSLMSIFTINSLNSTEDPLVILGNKIHSSNTSNSNMINLVIDEDSSFTRFNINLTLMVNGKNVKVYSAQEKIYKDWASSQDQMQFLTIDENITISFNFTKGEEVISNGLYDFNSYTNYFIRFNYFIVNDCFLLNCIENSV